MFDDQELSCADCGATFVFTGKDQQFYEERGFSPPKRCRACRDKRKAAGGGGGGGGGGRGGPRGPGGGGGGGDRPRRDSGRDREARPMHDAVCAECGAATQVPFVPRGDRPVYCRDCFRAQRT